MRSFKNDHSNNIESFNRVESQTESNEQKDNTLVVLTNSIYYFLDNVFILKKDGNYILVVIHNSQVITHLKYTSLKGAKIAFDKLHKYKSWKMGIKAEWTQPYEPDSKWLKGKEKVLKNSKPQEPLKAYSI